MILHTGLQAPDALARVTHALLYTKELMDKGHEVRLLFDGAGTAWLGEILKPEHVFNKLLKSLQKGNVIYAVCDHCAGAYGVKGKMGGMENLLKGDFHGHPSFAELIEEDFIPVIL